MAAGGSQVPTTSNVGDWVAVVDEVKRLKKARYVGA